MSSIFKKHEAERLAVTHTPSAFTRTSSSSAREFMRRKAEEPDSGFQIDRNVAWLSGVDRIEHESIETQAAKLALEKIEELREASFAEAFEQGLWEGGEKAFAESKSEYERRLVELDRVLSSIAGMKSELLAHNEAHLIKLLLHMANRLAMGEIRARPEIILSVIEKAVAAARSDERVRVRVSQSDHQLIMAMREGAANVVGSLEELDALKDIKGIEIVPSEAVEPGGCIVETNYGSVDASIEKRLERLWSAMEPHIPEVKDTVGPE